MPVVSGLCAIVSLSGIWLEPLRTGLAFIVILSVQVAALILIAIKWW